MTVDISSLRRPRLPVDRSSDRLVALVSIALAIAFLIAAMAATALPTSVRLGAWLPLHLALAGGATTAIAGVMPFFTAALAAVPPTDARLRIAAVAAVAIGAIGVSAGVVGQAAGVSAAGGTLFVAGIVLVGIATLRPLAGSLGPSRGLITQAYVAALASVTIGATLATLYVAGWPPVVDGWSRLRLAHAWLNLVGFVSVVIATTLLHFFPTVIGTRIAARPSARATVASLVASAVLVGIGAGLGVDVLVRLGGVAALVGAGALAMYAIRAWATRARWTTDPGWHVVGMGGLISAIGWFMLGITLASGRLILHGAEPAGWSILTAGGPLVVGWMGLAVVASATHLVPAVGPGDQAAHARQRHLLGLAAWPRLLAMDVGIAALSVGLPFDAPQLVVAGTSLTGLGLVVTALLLGAAIRVGLRARRGSRTSA